MLEKEDVTEEPAEEGFIEENGEENHTSSEEEIEPGGEFYLNQEEIEDNIEKQELPIEGELSSENEEFFLEADNQEKESHVSSKEEEGTQEDSFVRPVEVNEILPNVLEENNFLDDQDKLNEASTFNIENDFDSYAEPFSLDASAFEGIENDYNEDYVMGDSNVVDLFNTQEFTLDNIPNMDAEEFTNTKQELTLDNTSTIDRDFAALLQEDDDLKTKSSPTKNDTDHFKVFEDEDEDLWSF